jgi:hypothetical protein
MAVAAGLNGDPSAGFVREIPRHQRCGAAQEGERADEHPPVAFRYQFRHPGAVGLRQDGHRVALGGPQVGVLFARVPAP